MPRGDSDDLAAGVREFRHARRLRFESKPSNLGLRGAASQKSYTNEENHSHNSFSCLIKHAQEAQPGMNERIKDAIKKSSIVSAITALHVSGNDIAKISVAFSPHTPTYIFNALCGHFAITICP